jgi:hypothetical protein
MKKEHLRKGAWAAGGVALLAVASALCVKGMKVVGERLKAKQEAQTAAFDEAELFEDEADVKVSVEADTEEEPVEIFEEEPAQQIYECKKRPAKAGRFFVYFRCGFSRRASAAASTSLIRSGTRNGKTQRLSAVVRPGAPLLRAYTHVNQSVPET